MGTIAALIAAIASGLLSSSAQSGDKSKVGGANVAENNGNIANFGNQNPDIKNTNVEKVTDTTQSQPQPQAPEANESKMDWASLAKKTADWYDSNSKGGQSQMMTTSNVSQPGQIANFR